MKSKRFAAFAALLLWFMAFGACANTAGTGQGGEQEDARSGNADPNNPTRFAYYDSGYGQNEVAELQYYIDFTYDGAGRQKTVTLYDADGYEMDHVECLDDRGNVILKLNNSGHSLTNLLAYDKTFFHVRSKMEYDDAGRCVKEYAIGNNADGWWVLEGNYIEYEYAESGRKAQESRYNEGTLHSYTVLEYDGSDRETGRKTYDAGGVLTEYSEVGYDAQGRRVSNVTYRSGGGIVSEWKAAYSESGQSTDLTVYYDDREPMTMHQEYDLDGNLIIDEEHGNEYGSDGYENGWKEEYDSDGNRIHYWEYSGVSDRLVEEREYAYARERFGDIEVEKCDISRAELDGGGGVAEGWDRSTSWSVVQYDGEDRPLASAHLWNLDGEVHTARVYEYGAVSGTPDYIYELSEQMKDAISRQESAE